MRYFKKVVDIVIKLMIPLVILSLMIGIAKTFLDLKLVFESPKISTGFNILVTNILSMFVVTLAFDEAVKVVLDWVNKNPLRKLNTLVIIVADHDCGGFAINGPYGTLSEAGDVVEAGWTSGDHTAVDTIIWSQGPGSQYLGKAVDNTYLYWVMKKVFK